MIKKAPVLSYRKVAWQFGSLGAVALIQLGLLVILSRILAPSEFGLVAIVNVVMAIIQVFSDFGASNYLLHKRDMTRQEMSSLYWLNVIAGAGGALLIVLLAYPAATFYRNDEITGLLFFAAGTFFVGSFSSQFQTLLIRDFRFELLARMDVLPRALGAAITVSLALGGWGASSVVIGVLAGTAAKVVYHFLMAGRESHPMLHFSPDSVRDGVKFGASNVAARMINAVRMNADIAIVGIYVSAHDLGLFSAARQLVASSVSVFNPLLSRIATPYLAAAKGGKEQVARIDMAYKAAILSIGPVYFFVAVMSQEIVDVFLGDQFRSCARILTLFSVFWMVRLAIGGVQSALSQAMGRSDIDMKWAIMITPLHLLVVVVFARFGVEAIALALAVMQVGTSMLAFRMIMMSLSEYPAVKVIRHVTIALGAAVPAALVVLATDKWLMPASASFISLGACLFIYALILSSFYYALFKLYRQEIKI